MIDASKRVILAPASTVQTVYAPSGTQDVRTIPSSTVQAVSAPGTGSTVESHLVSTTATIPVIFATTSTLGAAITGSSIGVTFPATSTLGAAVTIPTTSTIEALYSGIGYTPVEKDAQFVAAQASTIFWQPASGKKWYLTDLIISSLNAVTVDLIDTNSTLATFHFAANGGLVSNFKTPLVASATNGTLRVTTTAATLSILASGYEV